MKAALLFSWYFLDKSFPLIQKKPSSIELTFIHQGLSGGEKCIFLKNHKKPESQGIKENIHAVLFIQAVGRSTAAPPPPLSTHKSGGIHWTTLLAFRGYVSENTLVDVQVRKRCLNSVMSDDRSHSQPGGWLSSTTS